MATTKEFDDIMKCPVCAEVYTDPRLLPCGYTCCLKCIEAWSKEKQPCPVPQCRKELTLPSNGANGLEKYLDVVNLLEEKELQMKELSSVESKTSPCEACSGDEESVAEVQNIASVFCVEDKLNIETLHKTMPPKYCDQHKDHYLKVYCFECQTLICEMCFITSHKHHKCSEVNEVVDDLCKQLTVAAERGKNMLESLHEVENGFIEKDEKTGVEISGTPEQLKQMNELSLMKQKRMKEIESLREEIERRLLSVESYKKDVDEVRQKGTACDIARAASGLHDRADELLKFDVIEHKLADLGRVNDMVMSSDFVTDNATKTLGHLTIDTVKPAGIATTTFSTMLVY